MIDKVPDVVITDDLREELQRSECIICLQNIVSSSDDAIDESQPIKVLACNERAR